MYLKWLYFSHRNITFKVARFKINMKLSQNHGVELLRVRIEDNSRKVITDFVTGLIAERRKG